jgi:hypothetical protein
MRTQTRLPAALLTLVLAILACDLPIPPISFPTQIVGTAVPPASPDPNRVGTAVAQTLTAAAPGREVTTVPAATAVSPTPEGAGSLLPHALYYIAPDSAGMTQIFRLEPDGKTSRQLTSEAGSVSDYDVSPVDSGVAYVANNQLLHINKDASERVVLVEGGEVDLNNPFLSTVSSPVFSRDGRTLAYGYKGLQFYSFTTGESRLAIENQVDEVGGGLMVPRELYSPESYSPDGTKLLVTLSYYEGASSAIYYPATSSLVRWNVQSRVVADRCRNGRSDHPDPWRCRRWDVQCRPGGVSCARRSAIFLLWDGFELRGDVQPRLAATRPLCA